MRKSFPLTSERQKPERVAEQLKGQIKKYLRRERNKKLGEEFDYWAFDCQAGADQASASPLHEKELGKAIDQALEAKQEEIFLVIEARAAKRVSKPASE